MRVPLFVLHPGQPLPRLSVPLPPPEAAGVTIRERRKERLRVTF